MEKDSDLIRVLKELISNKDVESISISYKRVGEVEKANIKANKINDMN